MLPRTFAAKPAEQNRRAEEQKSRRPVEVEVKKTYLQVMRMVLG